jgi:transposase
VANGSLRSPRTPLQRSLDGVTQRQVRVAQYGCLPPVEGGNVVRAQLRHAARYYNDLIALERCRRRVYRELRDKYVDTSEQLERVESLAGELAEARQAIRQARTAEQHPRMEAAREHARAVNSRLKKARQSLAEVRMAARQNASLAAEVAELNARAGVWKKGLRALTPCYWGTYLLIEAAIDRAAKQSSDPQFRRRTGHERQLADGAYSGEGQIGVQLQRPLSVAALKLGRDRRARLLPAPERYKGHATSVRGLRSKASHLLWLRVDSDRRAPVWAAFPIILHRPLPDGAILKQITVQLKHRGTTQERWTASFLYELEMTTPVKKGGVVALDIGWRKRPDASLRVAYWVDDQGHHGEMTMPASIRARMRHASDLRALQDRYFNRARNWLVRWLGVATRHMVLSDSLTGSLPHLRSWRSPVRLEQLVLRWGSERFARDERIYDALARWRLWNRHMRQWERDERSRALGHRHEIYRGFAARVARDYGTVVFEDFDLSKARRVGPPEREPETHAPQRAQLYSSAPGELRRAITNAVVREGGVIMKVAATATTSTCNACGSICEWDQFEEVNHTCEHCGEQWDQDYNASKNLLRFALDELRRRSIP